MINNIDLLYSTTKLLRVNFPESMILIDSNNEDIKENDTFHVEVKELSNTSYLRYVEKIINIYITFVPAKSEEISEKLLIMQQQLNNIFDLTLSTLERKLVIENKTFSHNKDFITMNLSFNFIDGKLTDNLPDMDKYSQLMKELNLTLKERND